MKEQADKLYRIRHFDSNEDAENYINENSDAYVPIAMSDTNSYITILLKFRDSVI